MVVVVEIVGSLLVLALVGVATAGLWIGLLGVLGAVQLTRCGDCGHLAVDSASHGRRWCFVCRHGVGRRTSMALNLHPPTGDSWPGDETLAHG